MKTKSEKDICPECGEKLGEGHKPYRGLICNTCERDQYDRSIERKIDEAIEEGENK